MRIKLPEYVEFALQRLSENGHGAFVVGGCVRDSLRGEVPKDWDIATSAKPDDVMRIFCGHKILTHGEAYGTVAVIFNEAPIEITTYRKDGVYTDNRRPDDVSFTDSLREDLSRRDFSINALAFGQDTEVVDYFGGMADLEAGLIRCVGDARERFAEDALRILRALRFAARLSFTIEADTASAMYALRGSLDNIARERVCAELTGIMTGAGNGTAAVLHGYFDVICAAIPELAGCENCRCQNAFLAIQRSPPSLAVRLALLFYGFAGTKPIHSNLDFNNNMDISSNLGIRSNLDIGLAEGCYIHDSYCENTTRQALKRLRFKNDDIGDTTELIKHMGADISSSKIAVKRILFRMGERRFRLLLSARRALDPTGTDANACICAAEKWLDEIILDNECYSLKSMNINGDDLAGIGYKPGASMGGALKALLELVIAGALPNDHKLLMIEAQKLFT